MSKILCCLCGMSIVPNDAAMCIDCLKNELDTTSDFDKHLEIVQCKKCDRWNVSRDNWAHHDLESSSLLAICLKRINGLNEAKVLDAKWIWTEPHSKRLKLNVILERNVINDRARVQQNLIVEYVVKNKQCLDCIREATDHTWGCLIQLRQRHNNKSALCALENVIIKSGLQASILHIDITKEGLDLYFRYKNQADKIVDLIATNIPTKLKTSKKLISQNIHTSETKYEHTIFAEVAAVCKGDLIVTAKDLMIVTKISSCIHMISPISGKFIELTSMKYFAKPSWYPVVLSLHQLTSFIVLDITLLPTNSSSSSSSAISSAITGAAASSKSNNNSSSNTNNNAAAGAIVVMAEAEVCRESDMGVNDTSFMVMTHLGGILKPGDAVLGYDLSSMVIDDDLLEQLPFDRPDVVLIRKSYADKRKSSSHGNGSGNSKGNKNKGKKRGGGGGTSKNNSSSEIIESAASISSSSNNHQTAENSSSSNSNIESNATDNSNTAAADTTVVVTNLYGDTIDEETMRHYLDQVADEEEASVELENIVMEMAAAKNINSDSNNSSTSTR